MMYKDGFVCKTSSIEEWGLYSFGLCHYLVLNIGKNGDLRKLDSQIESLKVMGSRLCKGILPNSVKQTFMIKNDSLSLNIIINVQNLDQKLKIKDRANELGIKIY